MEQGATDRTELGSFCNGLGERWQSLRKAEVIGRGGFKKHSMDGVDVVTRGGECWGRRPHDVQVSGLSHPWPSFCELSSWVWKSGYWVEENWPAFSMMTPAPTHQTIPIIQAGCRPRPTSLPGSQPCPSLKLEFLCSCCLWSNISDPFGLIWHHPTHLSRLYQGPSPLLARIAHIPTSSDMMSLRPTWTPHMMYGTSWLDPWCRESCPLMEKDSWENWIVLWMYPCSNIAQKWMVLYSPDSLSWIESWTFANRSCLYYLIVWAFPSISDTEQWHVMPVN